MIKNLLLFSLLLTTSNLVVAQNLTFAQIIELRKKSLGDAEEFLTNKGWEFKDAYPPTKDKMGSATFTYNKSIMSSSAESFLTFIYSDISQNRISIQVNRKTKYTEFMNALKVAGYKLIKSEVDNGDLVKIYKTNTMVVKLTSSTSKNEFNTERAVWHLFICTKIDFELEFE